MQRTVVAILLGLSLVGPAAAQVPNVQQLLQGLTGGNQGQDQAMRDAFDRGYQRGRQDEARRQRSDQGSSQRSYRPGAEQRGLDQPYGQQGGSYHR